MHMCTFSRGRNVNISFIALAGSVQSEVQRGAPKMPRDNPYPISLSRFGLALAAARTKALACSSPAMFAGTRLDSDKNYFARQRMRLWSTSVANLGYYICCDNGWMDTTLL